MVDWNDYRYLLAVAEARSLSGAGRQLGVSHPTVYRRLRGMEARLGARLFDRRGNRYRLTAAGEEAVRAAHELSTEFDALERRLAGRDVAPSGTVRLTQLLQRNHLDKCNATHHWHSVLAPLSVEETE